MTIASLQVVYPLCYTRLTCYSKDAAMTRDANVLGVAHMLLEEYGKDAEIAAAGRADALLDEGAMDGYSFFARVLNAIAQLRNDELSDSGKEPPSRGLIRQRKSRAATTA